MKRNPRDGALARFRVLDLSQVRAGPTCVKQLADFGADVVKVEPPDSVDRPEMYVGPRDGGDMQNLHRNKRSMTLDLKSEKGREILLQLVKSADVVVENFRPAVKDRLRIGYADLQAVNPRIILVSISGFGQDGPYRGRPGFDQIIQGMCGLMSTTGEPAGPPMRAGASVIDVATGMYGALGALTALLEREASGLGQWVQVSLLHSGIGLMDYQATRFLVDGEVPGRAGNDHPTSMPTSAYPTADGFLNIGVADGPQWKSFCRTLELEALIEHPDYLNERLRSRNRVALSKILAEAFSRRTTAEWVSLLTAADVPSGPIYTMDQVFDDPQVRHCGIGAAVAHPHRGPIRLVSQVAELCRTPAHIAHTLEEKGASTVDVLSEAGYSAEMIQAFKAEGVV